MSRVWLVCSGDQFPIDQFELVEERGALQTYFSPIGTFVKFDILYSATIRDTVVGGMASC